jgi:hypothetical protein
VSGGCCGSDTGVEDLVVPDAAHLSRPDGVPAQGFPTGLPGGGRVAALAAAEPGTGGCCAG